VAIGLKTVSALDIVKDPRNVRVTRECGHQAAQFSVQPGRLHAPGVFRYKEPAPGKVNAEFTLIRELRTGDEDSRRWLFAAISAR